MSRDNIWNCKKSVNKAIEMKESVSLKKISKQKSSWMNREKWPFGILCTDLCISDLGEIFLFE